MALRSLAARRRLARRHPAPRALPGKHTRIARSPTRANLANPAVCQIDDPVAAVEALNNQAFEATRKHDTTTANHLEEQALVIALQLNPATGRIASPAALCAVVGCSRQTYDDAVRRYGGAQNARKQPRNTKTGVGLIVTLLRESGDKRFPRHDARPQRSTGSIADVAVMEVADALSARL